MLQKCILPTKGILATDTNMHNQPALTFYFKSNFISPKAWIWTFLNFSPKEQTSLPIAIPKGNTTTRSCGFEMGNR